MGEEDVINAPRKPCPACSRKHLGQAIVLLQESLQGYPEHRWLAVGHIAEAEAEIFGVYSDIAHRLREVRNQMMNDPDDVPDLMVFIKEITNRLRHNLRGCMICTNERPESNREDRIAMSVTNRVMEALVAARER